MAREYTERYYVPASLMLECRSAADSLGEFGSNNGGGDLQMDDRPPFWKLERHWVGLDVHL
jgi:hypothetical protein